MKRCIFYLPYELDEYGMRARMLRPRKMIQAFQEIGYEVFVIQGYAKERKRKIKKLKKHIRQGLKYDFMYAESSTMPTLLTEPHHYPTHPFLDFHFFRYLKKRGIKVGLFYCDIYWKFDTYGTELAKWKRLFAILNYKYDLVQYVRTLDCFYVPDLQISKYTGKKKLLAIARQLPPGVDNLMIHTQGEKKEQTPGKKLHIFYVGGIGLHYQIEELVKAVCDIEGCELTICCRKAEWEKEKHRFKELLNNRIHIIHESGDELEKYYEWADMCSLMFQVDELRKMAQPYKAYEYLAHEVPILVSKGSSIARLVEDNEIGCVVEYVTEKIKEVLKKIIANPEIIRKYKENCKQTKSKNLWTCRAQSVVEDLTK